MGKRTRFERNGNVYHHIQPVEVRNGRLIPKKKKRVMPWVVISGIVILGTALAFKFPLSKHAIVPDPAPEMQTYPFRQAVNQAMSAAELTQTAEFKEDWNSVVGLWQQAVNLMQDVPPSNPNYEVAQSKVQEYQRNLQYAQSNMKSRPSRSPDVPQFWSLGSDRDFVVYIQGTPTRLERADSECRETMFYGNSIIELEHGMVTAYDNLENNLKVSLDPSLVFGTLDNKNVWTLGSPRENVFRVQGTPTRVSTYQSINREVLYYGNSLIEITNGFVTSYGNFDNNLKVSISALFPQGASSSSETWTLGSTRSEVFQIQETPSQIQRYDSLCRETLHYGNSTIDLENGIVSGYDNFDSNLRVK